MGDAPLPVVGLTGGIAAGKSTVADRLRHHGVPVLDADRLAREIVEPGRPALEEIAATFGDEMLLPDGALDRGRLGGLVFSDPGALARLNAITHPRILALGAKRLERLAQEGYRWAIWEAALILDVGLMPHLEMVVVVLCDPETQVERIQRRDGLDSEAARARVEAQIDNDTRREKADVVLDNDGPVESLDG